ncbi:MAG: hypothetical protein JNL82_21305 [Myxococcales bacterium]|nr:hypothetical protein [Myxococcales bacterium]
MDWPSRVAALLRVVLVAAGVCLLGAVRPDLAPADPEPARCTNIDRPAPGPALTAERALGERLPPGPDPAACGLARDIFVSPAPRRIVEIRGPPLDPPAAAGRPRSSRGPPGQV